MDMPFLTKSRLTTIVMLAGCCLHLREAVGSNSVRGWGKWSTHLCMICTPEGPSAGSTPTRLKIDMPAFEAKLQFLGGSKDSGWTGCLWGLLRMGGGPVSLATPPRYTGSLFMDPQLYTTK
jgi:hypothetical protein